MTVVLCSWSGRQVGDLFELNVKLRCQKVKKTRSKWHYLREKKYRKRKSKSNTYGIIFNRTVSMYTQRLKHFKVSHLHPLQRNTFYTKVEKQKGRKGRLFPSSKFRTWRLQLLRKRWTFSLGASSCLLPSASSYFFLYFSPKFCLYIYVLDGSGKQKKERGQV